MIAIVKYNAGNVKSVQNALNRLNVDSIITDDAALLTAADKVIFPGVGEARTAMRYLREKKLDHVLKDLKQPFLGICLGLQLMCNHSEEGNTACLGIFDVTIKRFRTTLKVPHMGWNDFRLLKGNLFENISKNDTVYFVHSYYAELSRYTVAETDYEHPFSAAMQRDNFYAVQFHPEKSAEIGEQIIKNFLSL